MGGAPPARRTPRSCLQGQDASVGRKRSEERLGNKHTRNGQALGAVLSLALDPQGVVAVSGKGAGEVNVGRASLVADLAAAVEEHVLVDLGINLGKVVVVGGSWWKEEEEQNNLRKATRSMSGCRGGSQTQPAAAAAPQLHVDKRESKGQSAGLAPPRPSLQTYKDAAVLWLDARVVVAHRVGHFGKARVHGGLGRVATVPVLLLFLCCGRCGRGHCRCRGRCGLGVGVLQVCGRRRRGVQRSSPREAATGAQRAPSSMAGRQKTRRRLPVNVPSTHFGAG